MNLARAKENPPSGGNHWQQWAAFKEYPTAIRREIYVHDPEHGHPDMRREHR